jgi:hypothetical protein
VPQLPRYELRPHTPLISAPLQLPLWLDLDDLTRAEAANAPTIAPNFHAADFVEDVLSERLDLESYWRPIGLAGMRVPITMDQAMLGVTWDLRDVPAGLYQVVGYVFSPPYNAWEPRPGWIKIIDDMGELPAVTVESIDASLFDGQGRRVAGCVDAVPGSTLSAWFSLEDAAEGPRWQPFAQGVPVERDRFELCLHKPADGSAGIARVRVAITAPDGNATVAHAPDRLVLIGTPAPCTPSDDVCCEAPPAPAQPAMQPAMKPVAAGAPAPIVPELEPAERASSGGCSAARMDATCDMTVLACWMIALLCVRKLRG